MKKKFIFSIDGTITIDLLYLITSIINLIGIVVALNKWDNHYYFLLIFNILSFCFCLYQFFKDITISFFEADEMNELEDNQVEL